MTPRIDPSPGSVSLPSAPVHGRDASERRDDDSGAGGIAAGAADPGKEFRRTEGIPVVPSFDGFRAVAILGIVVLHLMVVYLAPVSGLNQFIALGALPNLIDVLLIVSGFVLFLPTVVAGGEFGSARAFAIRRFARLLPGLWLAIVICLLLVALWPVSPAPPLPSLSEIGLHAISLHHVAGFLDPGLVNGLSINGPIWTLSLEVTYYAVLPLIAGAYFRHPIAGLVAAAVIMIGWKVAMQNTSEIAELLGFAPDPERVIETRLLGQDQLPGLGFDFALGMTAAWAFVELRARRSAEFLSRWAGRWQLLSALALLPLFVMFGAQTDNTTAVAPALAREDLLLSILIPTAFATFMLATALAPPQRFDPFSTPIMRRLGDISYGIYVIHFPLVLLAAAALAATGSSLATSTDRFWLLAPIVVALALVYGYLSARFVERPARRWAHRFGRRSQAGVRPADGPRATTAADGLPDKT